MKMKLILTGSVVAHSPVKRSDPHVRLLDYQSAIFLWLSSGIFQQIDFFEGSDTPVVSHLHRHLADQTGIDLQEKRFDVSEAARKFGKGRAEAQLLRYAARETNGVFCKATGRIYVRNAQEIIRASSVKTGRRSILKGHGITDTRFFLADARWYMATLDPLLDLIDDNSPSTYIESIFESAKGWENLETEPQYYGINASSGKPIR